MTIGFRKKGLHFAIDCAMCLREVGDFDAVQNMEFMDWRRNEGPHKTTGGVCKRCKLNYGNRPVEDRKSKLYKKWESKEKEK
jgi:hypothetical protein